MSSARRTTPRSSRDPTRSPPGTPQPTCGATSRAGPWPGRSGARTTSQPDNRVVRRRHIPAHFSRQLTTYIDAILGWHWYTWQALHDALAQWYPTWPKDSKSDPTRILGDTTSAILFFTDTPGMFGPGQVRNAGAVNFNRQARSNGGSTTGTPGVASWQQEQEPPGQWPTDFRESTVGETASPMMRRVVARLADALRKSDIAAAMELFSSDAVFEDVPAHSQITSQSSIHTYLTKAASVLPYAGAGTGVRHVRGNKVAAVTPPRDRVGDLLHSVS
jgi:hypothetical protein